MVTIPGSAIGEAIALFRYREQVTGRQIPCDPDWQRVISESVEPALAGERGETDQQQCAYQAIRLAVWKSGQIQKAWTKAFPPPPALPPQPGLLPPAPLSWYRRWWQRITDCYRSIRQRINDLL